MFEDSSAPPRRSRAAVVLFVLLLLGSLAALLHLFHSFVTDVLLGLLCAGFAQPLYQRWLKRFPRPSMVAGAVTGVVAVLITLPTVFLLTSLTQQAAQAYELLLDWFYSDAFDEALFGGGFWSRRLQHMFELLGMEYSIDGIRRSFGEVARSLASMFSAQVNALVSNVFGAVYHFILLLVVVFYGLMDGPAIKRFVFDFSPLPDDEEQLIVDKFRDVGAAILFGNGVGSAVQGFFGGLSMWVCGLPSAGFWGTVMTLFAFLPLVGISVVVVPVTVYLAFSGPWWMAAGFAGFNVFQALLIENVVKTKLIGNRMQLHNGLIFFSLLGGLGTFGVLGILYGPLILVLFMTVVDLYRRGYRERLLAY